MGGMIMDMKEILLTGLIVLIVPFVCQKKSVMIPVFIGLITLCMKFPFDLPFNFQFDLRQILLILGALYGGYIAAIWLALGIFTVHFLFEPNQFLNPFALLLICIFVPYFANRIHQFSLKSKMLITIGIGIGAGMITFLTAVPIVGLGYHYGSVLEYLLNVGIGLGVAVYLNELAISKQVISGGDLTNVSP